MEKFYSGYDHKYDKKLETDVRRTSKMKFKEPPNGVITDDELRHFIKEIGKSEKALYRMKVKRIVKANLILGIIAITTFLIVSSCGRANFRSVKITRPAEEVTITTSTTYKCINWDDINDKVVIVKTIDGYYEAGSEKESE